MHALAFVAVAQTHPRPSYPRQEVLSELKLDAVLRIKPQVEQLWLLKSDCGKVINHAISSGLYINQQIDEMFLADNIPIRDLNDFLSIFGEEIEAIRKNAKLGESLLFEYYDLTR